MPDPRRQLILWFVFGFVVSLRGEFQNPLDDENEITFNFTTLWDILKPQGARPYFHDLNGHWSFNDTIDISKYEEFDHTKFEHWFSGSRESLEDLLAKLREQNSREVSTPPPEDLPVFDTNLVTNSTAQLGATAYLHCRVRNLNSRAVSWVRRRDWHILTSAMFTYTNDERFEVIHQEGSDDWTLQIKYVQKRDQGDYECQVATGKGTLSQFFYLNVLVPTAYILGTGEYHIGKGSTISLVCIIENSLVPPELVSWYHNDKIIYHKDTPVSNDLPASVAEDGTTWRAHIVTDTDASDKTYSRLLITDATTADSGNYTCQASLTEPDSVYVFVSSVGDNIAAIQRQDASAGIKPNIALLALLLNAAGMFHCPRRKISEVRPAPAVEGDRLGELPVKHPFHHPNISQLASFIGIRKRLNNTPQVL